MGGRSEKHPEILTRALGGVAIEAKISFPRKEVFPGRGDQAWSNDHFVWIFRFSNLHLATMACTFLSGRPQPWVFSSTSNAPPSDQTPLLLV